MFEITHETNVTHTPDVESPIRIYKNFAEMCKDLEGEVYSSDSKTAFLKYLTQFFDYSKLGTSHKYAIYRKKREYTPYKDRDKVVIRESKWNNNIAKIILHELFTTFTGDSRKSILATSRELVLYSKDLYNMVGLTSAKLFNLREHGASMASSDEAFQSVFLDYCRTLRDDKELSLSSIPQEELEQLYKGVVEWFHSTLSAFSDITARVLEELHKRSIIFYEKTYVILKEGEPKLRLCSRKEQEEIHLAKGIVNSTFNIKYERDAIRKGIGKKYYALLTKTLRENHNILVSYSVHRIAFGEKSGEMIRRFMLTEAEKLGFLKDTNEKSIDSLLARDVDKKALIDLLIPVSL